MEPAHTVETVEPLARHFMFDDRIGLELGYNHNMQYFPQYEQFNAYQQPEVKSKVLRVGNVLQVVPTEDSEPLQQNMVLLSFFSLK